MAKANKNNTSRNNTTSPKAAAQASPVAPVVAQQAPAAAQAPAAVVAPAKPVGHINSLANVLAPAPVAKAAKASTAIARTGACNTRPGTKAALICGALTAQPQSMRALMAAAQQGQTFYNLLNGLVAKGLVAKHPCGGYSLPAAQPSTTPAAS